MPMTTTRALAACLAILVGAAGTAAAQTPTTSPVTGSTPTVTAPPTAVRPPPVTSTTPVPTVPPTELRLQPVRPLVGVWQAERDLEDGATREITQLDFRDDGTLLVLFFTDVQRKNGRKPVVSRYRYAFRGVENGVYTLEFEYTGADREVAAEDRRRLARFALAGAGTLRTDDGEILTRIR
jgi:hypothetical protein